MAMQIKLNSTVLPKHAKFKEKTTDQIAKNRALSGELTVDYWASIRGWTVEFPIIDMIDWDTMQAIYMSQYTTGNMVHLEVISDDVNIDTYVFMNAPDRNMRWGGQVVDGFGFDLEEAYANS